MARVRDEDVEALKRIRHTLDEMIASIERRALLDDPEGAVRELVRAWRETTRFDTTSLLRIVREEMNG